MDTLKQLVAFVLIAFVAFLIGRAYGAKGGYSAGWQDGRNATVRYYTEYIRTNGLGIAVVPVILTDPAATNIIAQPKREE